MRLRSRRPKIPTDTYSLAIIGVIALVVVWLVFSVFRKVFGLVLLVAVALGAWALWSDPVLLQNVTEAVTEFFSR